MSLKVGFFPSRDPDGPVFDFWKLSKWGGGGVEAVSA